MPSNSSSWSLVLLCYRQLLSGPEIRSRQRPSILLASTGNPINEASVGMISTVITALGCSNAASPLRQNRIRSEEHTSELQSLMRISYAVFCLKKKKDTHMTTHQSL